MNDYIFGLKTTTNDGTTYYIRDCEGVVQQWRMGTTLTPTIDYDNSATVSTGYFNISSPVTVTLDSNYEINHELLMDIVYGSRKANHTPNNDEGINKELVISNELLDAINEFSKGDINGEKKEV